MVGNLAKLASAINRSSEHRNVFVERRSEARVWCSDLVQIWCKAEEVWKRKGLAVLEDISRSGACVQLETQIANGTPVRLKHPRWKVEGVVRYCMYRDQGYFVGIRFAEEFKWDEQGFKPKHLVDPAKVATKKKK